jgi:hypothetical protein
MKRIDHSIWDFRVVFGEIYMKNHKKVLIPILMILVSFSICYPVSADSTTNYYDYSPAEIYGDWNPTYNRAIEYSYNSVYRCDLVFEFTGVTQSADAYWINLDYDCESPGYWPYVESLVMKYRWSNSGTWTIISFLDIIAFDGDLDITSATSSILYLRFTDCAPEDIGAANTWYFGYEPYLTAYFE